MRFAQIRNMDISNGEGIGVALFVQGCHFHCYNCFNSETWDFNGGHEWTKETMSQLLELINKPFIKRISILGGEPLANENIEEVMYLINEIRVSFPEKIIWLYTGYTWEELFYDKEQYIPNSTSKTMLGNIHNRRKRKNIVENVDILVDGRYIDSQRDITLPWRGSRNQRVIDVHESLGREKIILWT